MNRMMWILTLVLLASVAVAATAAEVEEKKEAAVEDSGQVEVKAQPAEAVADDADDAKAAEAAKVAAKAEAEKLLKTPEDRLSYAVGVDIARSFKNGELDINVEVLARAVADELEDRALLMGDGEVMTTLAALRARLKALYDKRQEEKQKSLAAQNKAKADAFLAKNTKAEGVVALPSGLQYKVLRQGAGESPTPMDRVTVHYRGAILDGTEFDSSYNGPEFGGEGSYNRKQPRTFRVGDVIQGWQESLQRMKVGSKWQIWVPPHLAYGPHRRGPVIGPNDLLVFEVELLGIEKSKPPEPKPDNEK
jgi:FKBP-type peptidyl-prolyl cis-trans isomerase FklB